MQLLEPASDGSQAPVTLAPEELTYFSGLYRHQTCTWGPYPPPRHTCKHIIKNRINLSEIWLYILTEWLIQTCNNLFLLNIYLFVCVVNPHVCRCMSPCVFLWRQEDHVRGLPHLSSALFLRHGLSLNQAPLLLCPTTGLYGVISKPGFYLFAGLKSGPCKASTLPTEPARSPSQG